MWLNVNDAQNYEFDSFDVRLCFLASLISHQEEMVHLVEAVENNDLRGLWQWQLTRGQNVKPPLDLLGEEITR